MINEILDGFWFGNKQIDFPADMGEEERKLVQYLENFKNGRFENKKEFVEFFTEAEDWKIFVVGMNIFMAVACHEDFQLLEPYFDKWDEDRTTSFLVFADESLSCQVLPYLLTLLEVWDETEVGEDASCVICNIIQYKKDYKALFEEMKKTGKWFHEEPYNIEDMGKACKKFVSSHDMNKYYFNGKELFLGDLTKELMSMVMECHVKREPFGFSIIPSILSNSTGIECPVYSGVKIDEEVINKVMHYIEKIAKLNQKKGHKYFYNNLVE